MVSFSRFIVGIGAFIASTRHSSSRHDPGDYTSLMHRDHGTPSAALSVAPLSCIKLASSVSTSHFAASRIFGRSRQSARAGRSRLSMRSTLIHPTSNVTRLGQEHSPQLTISTAMPYDGPKDLATYDDRRALIVYGSNGSRDLAVYCRPTSLVPYTGPIDYVQFWVDPSHFELITHTYRPRFVVGAYLANDYSHLDPTDFERWAIENPIDMLLSGQSSYLREFFGLTSTRPLTIGELEHRFEDMASRAIAFLYALGVLFTLATTAFKEHVELRWALERRQYVALVKLPENERDLLALPGVINHEASTEKEKDFAAGGDWWKAVDHGILETGYSTSANFLELPDITTPESASPIPTGGPAQPEALQHQNQPNRLSKALPTRPSGPRFKTAAWRRCRAK